MKKISLSGKWNLECVNRQLKIQADVPGDNYSALMAADIIADPYVKMNEKDVQWVRDCDWSYQRDFQVNQELLDGKSVFLNADCLDTFAEIFINGKKAGTTENMFRRYRFEVKKLLKAGKNTVQIRFNSPVRIAAEEAEKQPFPVQWTGNNQVPHMNLIRKTQCHAGWDWGICMIPSGIYGELYLQRVESCRIEHVYTEQSHSKNQCKVTVITELAAAASGKMALTVEFGEMKQEIPVALKSGLNIVRTVFNISNPSLWWPAGHGEQPLYKLAVTTADECVEKEIGLRKVELINKKDKIGVSMTFRINGVDIFCKGANWIPADGFPQRQTPEVFERLLQDAVAANMNMLRVWGGGEYENDEFYNICDRLGIMLWHDMMFACALYPSTERFIANVRQEAEYQVKRLRSHASIVLWCGDNEVAGAVGWYGGKDTREKYLLNYAKLNWELGKAVNAADPERIFWPSSPCNGPESYGDGWHDDTQGDMHYWEVWHSGKPIEAYYNVIPRFCSEFGYQSFPEMKTIRQFADESDFNVTSPVMEHHQRNAAGNSKIINMFANYFRIPDGFENFIYLSQVQQALAIKAAVEYWRHLRPVCMGTIYWQLNDNWPVASWSSIDYFGRWKQLHYQAKRFFAPIIISSFQNKSGEVEVWVTNDLPADAECAATLSVMDFAGGVMKKVELKQKVKAGSAVKIAVYPVGKLIAIPETGFMHMRLDAKSAGQKYSHRNEHFFTQYKRCELAQTQVNTKTRKLPDGRLEITLATNKPVFFLRLEMKEQDGVFSNNSFTLIPGEPESIIFTPARGTKKAASPQMLLIKHLRQSYQ
jgi:beta-mannosidase